MNDFSLYLGPNLRNLDLDLRSKSILQGIAIFLKNWIYHLVNLDVTVSINSSFKMLITIKYRYSLDLDLDLDLESRSRRFEDLEI